jgi:hypothetical protein
MKRINHEEAYSLDGACTNWAVEFFSRMRRGEIGHHHHVAGPYLLRFAQEASWRETIGGFRTANRLTGLPGWRWRRRGRSISRGIGSGIYLRTNCVTFFESAPPQLLRLKQSFRLHCVDRPGRVGYLPHDRTPSRYSGRAYLSTTQSAHPHRDHFALGHLQLRHHGSPSIMAASHGLCRTHRNCRSVVITAISIGPPQIGDRPENLNALMVADMHRA